MTYILLRAPSTQEDAGRVETVGHYATREDAHAEINRLTASGYFTPSSFTLVDTLADRVAAAAPAMLALLRDPQTESISWLDQRDRVLAFIDGEETNA